MSRKQSRRRNHDPELSQGIIAILLALLSVIIVLSFFNKAGVVGEMLDGYILSILFGKTRIVLPAIILYSAYLLLMEKKGLARKTHITGGLVAFFSIATLFHLGFAPENMWREALEGTGGGIAGMLAWPLVTYTGFLATLIILFGLLLIAGVLLFEKKITDIVLPKKQVMNGLQGAGTKFSSTMNTLFAGEEGEEEEDVFEEEEKEETEEAPAFSEKRIQSDEEESENEEEEEKDEPPRKQPKEELVDKAASYQDNIIIKDTPPLTLLSDKKGKPTSGDIKANQQIIKETFGEFRIDVDMGAISVGPTVTQFTLKPAKGVKLSRMTSLTNNLALSLAAHPIRMEAPIPGTSLVGIEVPNEKAAQVSLRELLESKEFSTRKHGLMIALGKDVAGKVWFADLPKMPHLLIAGTTGSGKTVCINTVLMSLLYQNTAETLRMILVDPKRVELTLYNGIPHLLTPVITNVQKTINALKWTIGEMDRRFEILSQAGNRDIGSYNESHPNEKFPHIVFVIDELADLMQSAGNEVEAGIIRVAQMARAVGIHLILATQRPSVDVITGLMKANIPGRIAFSVASLIDSRTILDTPGAEKLLGRGDMLLSTAELTKPVRIQGAYISEAEVKRVIDYLKGDEEPTYDTSIVERGAGSGTMNMFGGPNDTQDPMYEEAKQAIIESGKASASYLQRRLRLGYARAARILDELEEAGVIGPADGSKPREILVTEYEAEATMDMGGDFNVYEQPASRPKEVKQEEAESEEEENLDILSEKEDNTEEPDEESQDEKVTDDELEEQNEKIPF